MDRALEDYYLKKSELSINNKKYREFVKTLSEWYLVNDSFKNDITSSSFLKKINYKNLLRARIISNHKGVLSGIEEVGFILDGLNIKHKNKIKDSESFEKDQVLIEFFTDYKLLLGIERTILNLLQRMTGIATTTSSLVGVISKDAKGPKLASTRKTPLMLIDKKAVLSGGGLTHRLNLEDEILLKENHLTVIGKKFNLSSEVLLFEKALELSEVKKKSVCIEVETEDGALNLPKFFFGKYPAKNLIMLLDNFKPESISKIISLNKKNYKERIYYEASGGINKDNISDFAKLKIDVISMGNITNSAVAADMSLDII